MIAGKTVIGIIPARSGSKRIRHKNLAPLAGRPLIAWTIEAGLGAHYIDEVVVSTDDQEIAQVSSSLGAQVPFSRPAELARDESDTVGVIEHAIMHYKNSENRSFDYVVLLQPTSPLRDASEIDRAIELLHERGADAVISVCETDHSPLWSNTLPNDASLGGFLREEVKGKRSQDLPVYYRLNGAIYICRTDLLLKERTFFLANNAYALVMPREKSIDIDTPLDLILCDAVAKAFLDKLS
jgi:CMP-N,N'-diacetyllegionaminic acid synthase